MSGCALESGTGVRRGGPSGSPRGDTAAPLACGAGSPRGGSQASFSVHPAGHPDLPQGRGLRQALTLHEAEPPRAGHQGGVALQTGQDPPCPPRPCLPPHGAVGPLCPTSVTARGSLVSSQNDTDRLGSHLGIQLDLLVVAYPQPVPPALKTWGVVCPVSLGSSPLSLPALLAHLSHLRPRLSSPGRCRGLG